MELVEGMDLARHMARTAIPLDEALSIARQIVEALEAAHEKGLVHRDLKPSNIMLTPEGHVKVLDFGLAKPIEAADAADSPTATAPAHTRTGSVLGTAAYMSPEQAMGKDVDRRTDIWAFGCVLYELLTRTRAFPGDTAAEAVASVLRAEPDWTRLPLALPSQIRTLLARCLTKDRHARMADISTARYVLDDLASSPAEERGISTAPTPPWQRRPLTWTVVGLIGVGLALVLGLPRQPALSSSAGEVRAGLSLAPGLSVPGASEVAFSSDGTIVVFQARTRAALALPPTSFGGREHRDRRHEGGTAPFFSPDGQWLGFFDGRTLMKLPAGGGRPTSIAEFESVAGASWGDDGFIVVGTRTGNRFVPRRRGGRLARAADGADR